jgi:pimeloyl-ACP methyl ester carboxylesterase
MPEVVTSRQEQPVFFPAGDDMLFGVVTEPVGEPRGVAVILLYGGGYTMSSYYNQYWTRMARRVAAQGFHALRFDHHGNGDSTGRVDEFDHRAPFSDDMEAAMRFMETQGVRKFLVVGDCLGARGALVAASHVEEVDGVFMISAMVRDGRMDKADDWAREYGLGHYLRRAFRWKTVRKLASRDMRRAYMKVASSKLKSAAPKGRSAFGGSQTPQDQDNGGASTRFLGPLEIVLGRGANVHFVFGADDEQRSAEFEMARAASLGRILGAAETQVEINVVPGTIANIQDVTAQDAIIDLVSDWVTRVGDRT